MTRKEKKFAAQHMLMLFVQKGRTEFCHRNYTASVFPDDMTVMIDTSYDDKHGRTVIKQTYFTIGAC